MTTTYEPPGSLDTMYVFRDSPYPSEAMKGILGDLNISFTEDPTELGQRLYSDLIKFYQDPNHRERVDLRHYEDAPHVDVVFHDFLRIHGMALFGEEVRYQNPGVPAYNDTMDDTELKTSFKPVRRALLHLSQEWRKKLKTLGIQVPKYRKTSPSQARNLGRERPITESASVNFDLPSTDLQYSSSSLSSTAPQTLLQDERPPFSPTSGSEPIDSHDTNDIKPVLLQKSSSRALGRTFINSKPAKRTLAALDLDEIEPPESLPTKRVDRKITQTAASEHADESLMESSVPTQTTSPKSTAAQTVVKLCIQNSRYQWREWSYGRLSEHNTNSLFNTVAKSYRIQNNANFIKVVFFFIDSKPEAVFTVRRDVAEDLEEAMGGIRDKIVAEQHRGDFRVCILPILAAVEEENLEIRM